MSSILDALERLERERSPGSPPPVLPPPRRRRFAAVSGGVVALALLAAAVGHLLPFLRRAVPPGAPSEPLARPLSDPVRDVSSSLTADRTATAGEVTRPAPVAPPSPGAPPLAIPVEPPPEPEPVVAPSRADGLRALPPPTIASQPTAEDTPWVATAPAGAPEVHVAFLLYSARPERRSVALKLDGGPLVTAREGDEIEEVTVVRIRPDHVELAWRGERFAVFTHR